MESTTTGSLRVSGEPGRGNDEDDDSVEDDPRWESRRLRARAEAARQQLARIVEGTRQARAQSRQLLADVWATFKQSSPHPPLRAHPRAWTVRVPPPPHP